MTATAEPLADALANVLMTEVPSPALRFIRDNADFYTRRMRPEYFVAAVFLRFTPFEADAIERAAPRAFGLGLSPALVRVCLQQMSDVL
jgi:hypothetical protein